MNKRLILSVMMAASMALPAGAAPVVQPGETIKGKTAFDSIWDFWCEQVLGFDAEGNPITKGKTNPAAPEIKQDAPALPMQSLTGQPEVISDTQGMEALPDTPPLPDERQPHPSLPDTPELPDERQPHPSLPDTPPLPDERQFLPIPGLEPKRPIPRPDVKGQAPQPAPDAKGFQPQVSPDVKGQRPQQNPGTKGNQGTDPGVKGNGGSQPGTKGDSGSKGNSGSKGDSGSKGNTGTPDTQRPVPQVPDVKGPGSKTPDTKTPDTQTPDTKTPAPKQPDQKTPDQQKPDQKKPDQKKPDTKGDKGTDPNANGNGNGNGNVPTPAPKPSTTPAPGPNPSTAPSSRRKVIRIAGETRFETAIEVSRREYPKGAKAVILARGDVAADSVSAVPLAEEYDAPILLSPSTSLHPGTAAEIKRLMPNGGKVILMGGEVALNKDVADAVTKLGGQVERLAGQNRAGTAVETANRLHKEGRMKEFLVADGTDWQADLIAGPAAAEVDGVTLLTNGAMVAPETVSFMRQHSSVKATAIGSNAVKATGLMSRVEGASATELSLNVAKHFFKAPKAVGVATTVDFADALAGGAQVAEQDGPILLTPPMIPASLVNYLDAYPSIATVVVYGGVQRFTDDQIALLGK